MRFLAAPGSTWHLGSLSYMGYASGKESKYCCCRRSPYIRTYVLFIGSSRAQAALPLFITPTLKPPTNTKTGIMS